MPASRDEPLLPPLSWVWEDDAVVEDPDALYPYFSDWLAELRANFSRGDRDSNDDDTDTYSFGKMVAYATTLPGGGVAGMLDAEPEIDQEVVIGPYVRGSTYGYVEFTGSPPTIIVNRCPTRPGAMCMLEYHEETEQLEPGYGNRVPSSRNAGVPAYKQAVPDGVEDVEVGSGEVRNMSFSLSIAGSTMLRSVAVPSLAAGLSFEPPRIFSLQARKQAIVFSGCSQPDAFLAASYKLDCDDQIRLMAMPVLRSIKPVINNNIVYVKLLGIYLPPFPKCLLPIGECPLLDGEAEEAGAWGNFSDQFSSIVADRMQALQDDVEGEIASANQTLNEAKALFSTKTMTRTRSITPTRTPTPGGKAAAEAEDENPNSCYGGKGAKSKGSTQPTRTARTLWAEAASHDGDAYRDSFVASALARRRVHAVAPSSVQRAAMGDIASALAGYTALPDGSSDGLVLLAPGLRAAAPRRRLLDATQTGAGGRAGAAAAASGADGVANPYSLLYGPVWGARAALAAPRSRLRALANVVQAKKESGCGTSFEDADVDLGLGDLSPIDLRDACIGGSMPVFSGTRNLYTYFTLYIVVVIPVEFTASLDMDARVDLAGSLCIDKREVQLTLIPGARLRASVSVAISLGSECVCGSSGGDGWVRWAVAQRRPDGVAAVGGAPGR
jgi:hypothetical protein